MTPIEYIGPIPQKKKRKPVLGGWVILLMSGLFVSYFAWPTFADYVKTQQDVATEDKASVLISQLVGSERFGDRLAGAALQRTQVPSSYDGAYYTISYPMGDVPEGKGVGADVLVRSYRGVGIDLQQLVHEDMRENFRLYPQLWGQKETDTNIDHRRIPNLQRFFVRNGLEIPVSRIPSDYHVGDLVAWRLPNGDTHIGIVVPGPGSRYEERWVVHNQGEGTQWDNALLDHEIVGHYRFGK
ncbi:DUF1287 domain-containing protein [Rubritalea tangerina]|uniref:DUF1287 domain-containing protein n=1 Tax=Rubritalea tangerina TaxID=430798 RepID=A0ABW4ZDE5_9BACT